MPTDRPRTKSATKTWLVKEQLKRQGYPIPGETGRCVTRPRLWLRYMLAIDMAAQALGVSVDTMVSSINYRLRRFDHGHQRAPVLIKHFTQRALRDKNLQAVCPVCGSVLDLDSRTWTPNPEAESLEPLDLLDPETADAQVNSVRHTFPVREVLVSHFFSQGQWAGFNEAEARGRRPGAPTPPLVLPHTPRNGIWDL